MTEEPTGSTSVTPNGGDAFAESASTSNFSSNSPALDNGGQNQPTPVEWDTLPSSWQKDFETDWKGLPERVRQYAHNRERQISEGFRRYGAVANNWNKATESFRPIMEQNPDLDMGELFQTLAHNHFLLTQTNDPGQKRALLTALAQNYGVDFAQAAAQGAQPPSQSQQDLPLSRSQLAALEKILNPLVQTVQTLHGSHQQQQMTSARQVVDNFFSNPQNKFAGEVEAEILQVIKSGVTKDLGEAYQLALIRKPEVHAKHIAELSKGAVSSSGTFPNLKSASNAPSSSQTGTIEDTMHAVVQKAFPGWKARH